MMFRRLYWVTEQVDSLGNSRILGVYTSIPELIRHGLNGDEIKGRLRLTLTKLDSDKGLFGTWSEPQFHGLAERLNDFVQTDEFSPEHCQMLLEALKRRSSSIAA